jgi:hypothetical protein
MNMNEYYNKRFEKAFPYAVSGTVMGPETYVKTSHGGYLGPTRCLGHDIGEAAANLMCITRANRETEE